MATNVGGTERIVRGLVGTALLLVGLGGRGRFAVRVVALLAGAELLQTARTCYCPANDALGRNTASEERELAELPA